MQGDVYHLVFELGEWLDGRVWPSEDELDVLRMVDLIEHLTGEGPIPLVSRVSINLCPQIGTVNG